MMSTTPPTDPMMMACQGSVMWQFAVTDTSPARTPLRPMEMSQMPKMAFPMKVDTMPPIAPPMVVLTTTLPCDHACCQMM